LILKRQFKINLSAFAMYYDIAAIGGIWQTMPVELEWVELE